MEYSCFILKCSWVWVVIVTVLSQAYTSRCCVEHEKAALLQIRSYFMSKPTAFFSKELSSWDSNGNEDCCMWKRVRCNAAAQVVELSLAYLLSEVPHYNVLNLSLFKPLGELVSLDISGNGINRTDGNGGHNTLNLTNLEILDFGDNALTQHQDIANLVGSLTSLKKLNLAENQMVANFPGRELAHLKKLEVLDLKFNSLYGYVKGQDLAHFKKLRVLDLSENNLNGSLPGQGICPLRNLEELNLKGNVFGGNFPECLWNLTSLRILDLTRNSFTGNLPPLINLPSLHLLSIYDNSFQGRVSLSYLMNHSRLLDTLDLSNNALQVDVGDSSYSLPSKLVFIGLSQCTLSGQFNTFPKFLSNISNLEYLDVSSNRLFGLFPEWLLQNNPNIQYLNLGNNSIVGSLQIPNHSNLSSLIFLDVSSNNLKEEIPYHIGMVLSSLQFFNVSHNSFLGHIPASVGNMMQLEALDLSNNHLIGTVPRKLFYNAGNLMYLLLSNNHLQGEIIPSYMNLPSLDTLYLDNNNFVGTIKGSMRMSEELNNLDISNNRATGILPSWIEDFEVLKSMSLAGNGFHGDIPSQLCNLVSLEFLDLSKNRFTGAIPSCDTLMQLKFLHLHGNHLTGEIPEGLKRFSSLITLDLSNNQLSGDIPQWIDQLSDLVILLLGGNQLEGDLPSQLCRLKFVNIIDLSNNDISGSIPTCFGNISFGALEFATLYTYGNSILSFDDSYSEFEIEENVYLRQEEVEFIAKSRYSSYKGSILSVMSDLDLSDNKLSGEIPPELGELGKIHALNLSHNHLSGSIPTSFSKLKSIESLDLSSNNLSGTIPSELVDLTSLGTFSVSYNNLSGEVPETGQFGTFDESSYSGNPLLCGSWLPRSCKMGESVPTQNNTTGEGDEGFDMEVFLWSFGMSSVTIFLALNVILAINPYWRRAWFAFVYVKFLWWFGSTFERKASYPFQ